MSIDTLSRVAKGASRLYWCKFQTIVFHHGMVTGSLMSARREALWPYCAIDYRGRLAPLAARKNKKPGSAGRETSRIHETIRQSPTTRVRVRGPAICQMSRLAVASGFSPRYRLRRNPIRRIPERSKSLESFRRPYGERCMQRTPCAVLRVTRCRRGDNGS